MTSEEHPKNVARPTSSRILCFDVEALSLHKTGFAVGAVILDRDGVEVDSFYARASRIGKTNAWTRKNVIPFLAPPTHERVIDVRSAFWEWMRANVEPVTRIVADCPWPVEANFLSACVADDPIEREYKGPYPIIDASSLLFVAGLSPVGGYSSLVLSPEEQAAYRAHDPVWDARVSARLARLCLERIEASLAGYPALSSRLFVRDLRARERPRGDLRLVPMEET